MVYAIVFFIIYTVCFIATSVYMLRNVNPSFILVEGLLLTLLVTLGVAALWPVFWFQKLRHMD